MDVEYSNVHFQSNNYQQMKTSIMDMEYSNVHQLAANDYEKKVKCSTWLDILVTCKKHSVQIYNQLQTEMQCYKKKHIKREPKLKVVEKKLCQKKNGRNDIISMDKTLKL